MKYQGYLIDLDGTMYLGEEPIPAAKGFIEALQQQEIPFLFVTNNTTKHPKEVQKKLSEQFDIHVKESNVYTATLATVDYMKELNLGNKVYIIGESGLREGILEAGFVMDESNPDYVVVGLDREITYEKLMIATLAIRKGARFIGTNPDKNLPTDKGLIPGAGSFISFFETATQEKATIIGKPQSVIMDKALEQLQLKKDEVIMVGDNYETDIKAGINNGIDTLLVLTGFTPASTVDSLPIQPTFVINSLESWEF